ncbi:methyltransferase [Streptosporangium sp. NPDC002524]|uniref:methyltransferase n=1 Tax=Streptosporangium sp. NPDC002524 TaxID=3154537 RepID=UPI00331A6033
MPLHLTPEDARRYLESGEAPGPHLDVIGAMSAHAAAAGLRLGLFEALADGPRDLPELAAGLGADRDGLRVLLGALAATGYVTSEPGGYALTAVSRPLLGGYGNTLLFWQEVLAGLWGGLEESVRSGRRGADFYAWLAGRPEVLARFQRLLQDQAGWLAEEIAAVVPLPRGASRLLDLGGGHARYSIAYCRDRPELGATVVDLPSGLDAGRSAVASAGMDDRVILLPGDILGDLPYRDQDAVLLFNLLHGFGEEQASALLRAAARTLRPGGVVLVLDRDPGHPGDAAMRAFTPLFELNLHHTQGGRLYSPETITRWLAEAGCHGPQEYVLTRSPAHLLTVATRA